MMLQCGSVCAGSWTFVALKKCETKQASPCQVEGWDLRSATRSRDCAFWASWADVLPTIRKRHPAVADQICVALQRGDVDYHFVEAAQCRESKHQRFRITRVGRRRQGIATRPNFVGRPHGRSGSTGLAKGRCAALEERFRTDIVWPRLDPPGQAFLRFQSRPMAGVPFCCFPVSMATNRRSSAFEAPLVSVTFVLSKLPVWPSTCQVAGVLGRRGFPIESAVARVCREAGDRATTNVRVQDLDIPLGAARTTVVWRWSWTDCHCFTVHGSQWTRRWCPQCGETDQLADNAPRQTVQP